MSGFEFPLCCTSGEGDALVIVCMQVIGLSRPQWDHLRMLTVGISDTRLLKRPIPKSIQKEVSVRFFASTLVVLLVLANIPTRAQTEDDKASLAGLKEIRIVFDLTNGDPKGLAATLSVIDETRKSLIGQDVRPRIVLAFRGPATKLVQTDLSLLATEDREITGQIAKAITKLTTAQGIDAIEQCGIAVRNQSIKPEHVIPGVKVVGNGWISLAAYQAKGYGYIAP